MHLRAVDNIYGQLEAFGCIWRDFEEFDGTDEHLETVGCILVYLASKCNILNRISKVNMYKVIPFESIVGHLAAFESIRKYLLAIGSIRMDLVASWSI